MRALAALASGQTITIDLCGLACTPDPSGALYIEADGLLVVADLHLEKGSAFARRGVFLPPYDTAATLAKLAIAAARYRPRAIIALGDSFHDGFGADRLHDHDRAALTDLQAGRDWIWIAGNHDPEKPRDCGGEAMATVPCGPLTLRHEPSEARAFEIAGHLHPVARVRGQSGTVRRRCFVADGRRCVMPAFGAYAGGLNLRDEAFDPLFERADITAFALGRGRVHAVPQTRCVPD